MSFIKIKQFWTPSKNVVTAFNKSQTNCIAYICKKCKSSAMTQIYSDEEIVFISIEK